MKLQTQDLSKSPNQETPNNTNIHSLFKQFVTGTDWTIPL